MGQSQLLMRHVIGRCSSWGYGFGGQHHFRWRPLCLSLLSLNTSIVLMHVFKLVLGHEIGLFFIMASSVNSLQ